MRRLKRGVGRESLIYPIKKIDMEKPIIYTVGHSTHEVDAFLELIKSAGINCIVDVRSVPASAYTPQFNQEPLKKVLNENHIAYLHLPKEFGAQQTDEKLLDDEGKLDFEKMKETTAFKSGLERIRHGADKGYVIAIMCSESEPLDCHRFSLVSIGLENEGFEVKHLLKDKSVKTNDELKQELLKEYAKKIPQNNLFEREIPFEVQLQVALKLKNRKIGFSPSDD